MVYELPLTTNELEQLRELYGTPYQLYDEMAIRNNARNLLQKMKQRFPSFLEFFAVKALPNPAIAKILIQEGCGLDCSSTSELYLAQLLNVPGDKVMYTSNYTSKEDLEIAFDQGVIINLDDISLIDTLVEARGCCPDTICFRLNPGVGRTDSETSSNVLGGPKAKFGIPRYQIVEAYRKARDYGAKKFGIHMMTGSCVMNVAYWKETVTILCDVVKDVNAETGIVFDFMNIGGGIGIPYLPDEKAINIDEIADLINETIFKNFNGSGHEIPRLCMENGRYMTGPFGWLVSTCKAIKRSYETYYGLDACMAHCMRPGMYNAYHHIKIPKRENEEKEKANVVGDLCENNDWFASGRLLPKASVGDLFVIYDTGAHCHSMGFQYNGKLRAPELLIREDRHVNIIRERETYNSLYDNCVMPENL